MRTLLRLGPESTPGKGSTSTTQCLWRAMAEENGAYVMELVGCADGGSDALSTTWLQPSAPTSYPRLLMETATVVPHLQW